MKCYQCQKLKGKNPLTGNKATFGYGYCQPKAEITRCRKLLSEGCEYFISREIKDIRKIEKWMDESGITALIRFQS